MKIVLLVNNSWNFINFRKDFIEFLLNKNFEVHLMCEDRNYNLNLFKNLGCKIHFIVNSKKNFFISEVFKIYKIYKLLKEINPSVCLNFTLKSILFFTISSFFLNIKNINTFTGLGYIYLKHKFFYFTLILFIFIFSKKNNSFFVFHNSDDLILFKKFQFIKKIKMKVVNGSGVNVNKFRLKDKNININNSNITFTMISRLLKEKGIFEFCKTAECLSKFNSNLKFVLVSKSDINSPGLININEINKYIENKSITFINNENNIISHIKDSDCIVLPSYREGLSKLLLESLSMSKPIITTNVPGCRQLVNNNGFLCKPKNYLDLKKTILKFSKLDKKVIQVMCNKSRELAVSKYSTDIINSDYYALISEITH